VIRMVCPGCGAMVAAVPGQPARLCPGCVLDLMRQALGRPGVCECHDPRVFGHRCMVMVR